jgi:hypothetical protein
MIGINLDPMLPKAADGLEACAAGLLRLLGIKKIRSFSRGKTADVTPDAYSRVPGGEASCRAS